MRRREFICLLGSAAASPLVARAQQPELPVVGFIHPGAADAYALNAAAFRKGLNETGYVEGQNVAVEYHWLEGRYDRLPALVTDLLRRQVAVITIPGSLPAALAAKAATATIPIVFGVAEDPVRLGLVASLARPGGNATGINIFTNEVVTKRLQLLHELVPKAVRVAVLVNPANGPSAESTLRAAVQEAAPPSGCKSRRSTPRQSVKSMRPLPPLRASALTASWSPPTHSSAAAPCSLPAWQRATEFQRIIRCVFMWQPAGL
jgi:ABC-type uncharacterized transport system substrate-binding protein